MDTASSLVSLVVPMRHPPVTLVVLIAIGLLLLGAAGAIGAIVLPPADADPLLSPFRWDWSRRSA